MLRCHPTFLQFWRGVACKKDGLAGQVLTAVGNLKHTLDGESPGLVASFGMPGWLTPHDSLWDSQGIVEQCLQAHIRWLNSRLNSLEQWLASCAFPCRVAGPPGDGGVQP